MNFQPQSDLLSMSEAERSEASNVTLIWPTASAKWSNFTVRAAKTDKLKTCRKLYQSVMLNPTNMADNHLTAVYRLYAH